jgi:hypothetical protein
LLLRVRRFGGTEDHDVTGPGVRSIEDARAGIDRDTGSCRQVFFAVFFPETFHQPARRIEHRNARQIVDECVPAQLIDRDPSSFLFVEFHHQRRPGRRKLRGLPR